MNFTKIWCPRMVRKYMRSMCMLHGVENPCLRAILIWPDGCVEWRSVRYMYMLMGGRVVIVTQHAEQTKLPTRVRWVWCCVISIQHTSRSHWQPVSRDTVLYTPRCAPQINGLYSKPYGVRHIHYVRVTVPKQGSSLLFLKTCTQN